MKNIRRKTGNSVIVLLFLLFASSCVSTKSLIVEIPEPSKKELPANVQSLTIVTQTVDNKYTDLEADSLQKLFYKRNFDLDTVIYDRQVVDTTMQALGELLFESGRYDFVIPENRFLNSNRRSSPAGILSWEEVNYLCETYNTDAVLSLDYMSTRVSTDFNRESLYNPYDNGFYAGVKAEMKVIYEVIFRVYYPETENILVQETMRDTLLWEDADTSVRGLFSDFTPVKNALIETGISVALEFSDKIAVIWQTERRTYYHKGNNALEKANEYVNAGNWSEAIDIWEKLAEEAGSKSLKSKAQFNTAVGYEMLGDLNRAISRAVKSYKTMYRPLTYEYLELLKDRKEELEK
ncbi:MAG: DUF6340 family protein [Prolixibacteraceae bacterium]